MLDRKYVVLVVEDERPLLEAIRLKLEKTNFEFIGARTIEEAKNYMVSLTNIDVVWLDHYLIGKEDGLDFVEWCKNENNIKYREVPIFVISNTASPDKIATYMNLGANKYFIKSNHKLEDIISEISKVLSEKSGEKKE